jgi:hypothetical protein
MILEYLELVGKTSNVKVTKMCVRVKLLWLDNKTLGEVRGEPVRMEFYLFFEVSQ